MTTKTAKPECVWYSACPMKRFYTQGVLEARFVEDYCHGRFRECVRYRMEAAGEAHPDWMRPDGHLDERLKRASFHGNRRRQARRFQ